MKNHLKTIAFLPLLLACAALGHAGSPAKTLEQPVLESDQPSRVHVLVNLDFSDHYISLHGLNLENQGLIFQPLILTLWTVHHDESAFLQDLTLTAGVWNSIHTERSGPANERWNQTNPILGLTATFAGNWQLDVLGMQYISQTDFFPTSTNLSIKLTYKDKWSSGFSLNPYVEFWTELDEKATLVFNPATSEEGWYLSVGATPTYQFQSFPLKIEMHTYAYFVSDSFYQRIDGADGGSGFGLFSSFLKFSVPLTSVPKSLGNWSIYAGAQYYRFENDGLRDGNLVLADESRDPDLIQFRAGLSIYF